MTPNYDNDLRRYSLNGLIQLAHGAMKMAKDTQPNVIASNDSNVVTQGDTDVSAFIVAGFNQLATRLPTLSFLILDEEKAKSEGLTPADSRLQADWLLVSDPIDGSLLYSRGKPEFAVSLAIYYLGRPFVSVVLHADGTLLFFDGHTVFQHVTGHSPQALLPVSYTVDDAQMVMHSANPGLQYRLGFTRKGFGWNRYNPYGCVARMLGLVPLGNKLPMACASTHVDKFWDIAGMWPILEALGVRLYNIEGTVGGNPGEVIPVPCGFRSDLFGDTWRLNGIHLACLPENLEAILTGVFEPLRPAA